MPPKSQESQTGCLDDVYGQDLTRAKSNPFGDGPVDVIGHDACPAGFDRLEEVARRHARFGSAAGERPGFLARLAIPFCLFLDE
jgi:hypothetical protein